MIDVEVKTTEPQTTAYIAMRGAYDQIPTAMGRLYSWVMEHELQPEGMPSGIYLTDPETVPEADALWKLRAPLADEPQEVAPDESGCGIEKVAPHLVASTMHRGSYESLAGTYHQLEHWVTENGYSMVGPPEEIYYSDPDTTPPEEYLTEIQFPVQH